VIVDYTNLPSYPKLIPSLLYKNSSDRKELTILANIHREECNLIPSSEHSQNNTTFTPCSQIEGKEGKFLSPDNENEKVNLVSNKV